MKAKERTDRIRVHMPEADPKIRNKNSEEVNKGLDTPKVQFLKLPGVSIVLIQHVLMVVLLVSIFLNL